MGWFARWETDPRRGLTRQRCLPRLHPNLGWKFARNQLRGPVRWFARWETHPWRGFTWKQLRGPVGCSWSYFRMSRPGRALFRTRFWNRCFGVSWPPLQRCRGCGIRFRWCKRLHRGCALACLAHLGLRTRQWLCGYYGLLKPDCGDLKQGGLNGRLLGATFADLWFGCAPRYRLFVFVKSLRGCLPCVPSRERRPYFGNWIVSANCGCGFPWCMYSTPC